MNMRDFWAAEAAKMRDTSHLGISPAINDYFTNDDSPLGFMHDLMQTLTEFSPQIGYAKKQTKTDRVENGYVIYQGSDRNLYISDMIKESTEKPEITTLDKELDSPTAKRKVGDNTLLAKDKKIALTLVGIYHTHPDIGEDANPFSDGDINGLFTTIINKTYYRKWVIKLGFFVIADDVNGGRYAAVVENFVVANKAVNKTKEKYDNGFEANVGGASNQISGTSGKKARDYHKTVFINGTNRTDVTGIGMYFNMDNTSINLNRL